jgi:hypothetical protein
MLSNQAAFSQGVRVKQSAPNFNPSLWRRILATVLASGAKQSSPGPKLPQWRIA